MLTTKEKIVDILGVVLLWLMMVWDDIKDILKTVVVTFVTFFIITTFFFKPIMVNGTSMNPTILHGSIGFSSVVNKNISGIHRFDIVVVRLDQKNEDLIKRVIGLPGETVTYQNDQLYINGEAIEESFLDEQYVKQEKEKSGNGKFTNDFSITLDEDEYFCMGDNRIVSADSRIYGPFKSNKIKSIGVFIIFPFNRIGITNQ